ncbi:MAG: type II/IV secretion system protein, partial [Gammaproteobacteria bacterium]|nr:type II/IV secretion system protein [Gammaproteobacteria bacterium]
MQTQVITSSGNEKLTLDYVLKQLLEDGLITEQQHAQFTASHKPDNKTHPLIILSKEGWKTPGEQSYPLTLERLTQWLAEKTNIPYVRIDPLNVDVNKVTSLVSQAYAANLKILPLEMNSKELTVANCEPFFDSWEQELSRIVKLRIKRVLVNPKDIERYLIEFYGISRSILGAVMDSDGTRSKLQNFEQLIEVGKMGEPDANDQHIVSIVDWLLQFAFEQRASDIHLEPR